MYRIISLANCTGKNPVYMPVYPPVYMPVKTPVNMPVYPPALYKEKEEEDIKEKEEERAREADVSNGDVDEYGNPLPDPAWKQVCDRYLEQLGMMQGGVSAGHLMDFCDALGPDVVCAAIDQTNLANVDRPMRYLLAVLAKWQEAGVKTLQDVKQLIDAFERSKKETKARRDNGHAVKSGAGASQGDDTSREVPGGNGFSDLAATVKQY